MTETKGYCVVVSPPGAEGGVDILAGKGPLGFDPPRLVVQVESQDAAVDVSVLQGVMSQFNASRGASCRLGSRVTSIYAESSKPTSRLSGSGLWPKMTTTAYPLPGAWTLSL